MTNYTEFINTKRMLVPPSGFEVADFALNDMLFPFQRDIVRWALRRGKAAIFADCGLGKTPMQLEWAHQVCYHMGGQVLIVAPLAVSWQTAREGDKFGIAAHVSRSGQDVQPGINITNYERLHLYDPAQFIGIVLDESSILKAQFGIRRHEITDFAASIPYRLAASATPAPNDLVELINHAEFFGIMTEAEIKALFFTQDGNNSNQFRLKRHAVDEFWRWMASWSVAMRKPSDLGYDDMAFRLPPLHNHQVTVDVDAFDAGMLFAVEAVSLTEQRIARKSSLQARVDACAEMVNASDEPWLIWCDLNAESEALARAIPNAIEVTGSDEPDWKEKAAIWYIGDLCECQLKKSAGNTCVNGSKTIERISSNTGVLQQTSAMLGGENSMHWNQNEEQRQSGRRRNGEKEIRKPTLRRDSSRLESLQMNIEESSNHRAADVLFADESNLKTKAIALRAGDEDSTSIIATIPEWSGESYVHPAISGLGNSRTIQSFSNGRCNICGKPRQKKRVLISKPSIFGFGLNFQHCCKVAFVGLSHSYEKYYQAVRRSWRFGQKNPVDVYIITSTADGPVVQNIERKEKNAMEMYEQIVYHMSLESNWDRLGRQEMVYAEEVAHGTDWDLYLGDSVQTMRHIPDNTVGLSVFSPPFPGMYVYTNSVYDMGNVKDIDQMIDQYRFLMDAEHLMRVTMPGRNVVMHITQGVAQKGRDGYIGIKDFRGKIIAMMSGLGWLYYGEVIIDKNPQLKAVRTKDHGLMFGTLNKDAAGMHMALADILLQFRKPGENPEPISAGQHLGNDGWITNAEWINWARPVWYAADYMPGTVNIHSRSGESVGDPCPDGIRETDVLNVIQARETNDERHLAPLQLGVIERCIKLWSAPGDLIYSPFAGIGSEGYMALKLNRRFVGGELKRSYWQSAIRNLTTAEREKTSLTLFDFISETI